MLPCSNTLEHLRRRLPAKTVTVVDPNHFTDASDDTAMNICGLFNFTSPLVVFEPLINFALKSTACLIPMTPEENNRTIHQQKNNQGIKNTTATERNPAKP